MIPVFHYNDNSAKRPESFWLSVSKQHNSNVLLERWSGPLLEGEQGEQLLPQVFGTYLGFQKNLYQLTHIM